MTSDKYTNDKNDIPDEHWNEPDTSSCCSSTTTSNHTSSLNFRVLIVLARMVLVSKEDDFPKAN